MEATFLHLYYALFLLLSGYGLHRALLLLRLAKNRPQRKVRPLPEDPECFPIVTVQLPIFNELYVAERLVRAVAGLDWPRNRLEIQILDDSTDETGSALAALARELRREGFMIRHRRRTDREGFKAGALEAGLRDGGDSCPPEDRSPPRGDFLAIFDADFLPGPAFLRRTIPLLLADEGLGLVQARWEHLNRDHSLLTRLQAVFLDAHFAVEHRARQNAGHFLNFNGTAGVWRRRAIEEAGGWSHETLTEDLDLSFRAQMKGWRFAYLHDLGVPSELPVEMNAFKVQQHRWAKGAIETARKLLPRLWTAGEIPLGTRIEGTVHLTNNLAYLIMAAVSFLTLPAALTRDSGGSAGFAWADRWLLGIGLLPVLLYFLAGQRLTGRPFLRSLALLPAAISLGIGLSVNNARAVLEGIFGRRSAFVRTPKYRIDGREDTWLGKRYLAGRSFLRWIEVCLGLEAGAAAAVAWHAGAYSMAGFFLLFTAGYLYVAVLSLWPDAGERLRRRLQTLPVPPAMETAAGRS